MQIFFWWLLPFPALVPLQPSLRAPQTGSSFDWLCPKPDRCIMLRGTPGEWPRVLFIALSDPLKQRVEAIKYEPSSAMFKGYVRFVFVWAELCISQRAPASLSSPHPAAVVAFHVEKAFVSCSLLLLWCEKEEKALFKLKDFVYKYFFYTGYFFVASIIRKNPYKCLYFA